MVKSYTMVRLKKETVEKLKELGKKGETYDDIIRKLLDFYEKKKIIKIKGDGRDGGYCESM